MLILNNHINNLLMRPVQVFVRLTRLPRPLYLLGSHLLACRLRHQSHHSQQPQHLISLSNMYYRNYDMQSSSHLYPAKPGTKRSAEDYGSGRPPHYQRHANNTHSDVGIKPETSPTMQHSKSVSPLALGQPNRKPSLYR